MSEIVIYKIKYNFVSSFGFSDTHSYTSPVDLFFSKPTLFSFVSLNGVFLSKNVFS